MPQKCLAQIEKKVGQHIPRHNSDHYIDARCSDAKVKAKVFNIKGLKQANKVLKKIKICLFWPFEPRIMIHFTL